MLSKQLESLQVWLNETKNALDAITKANLEAVGLSDEVSDEVTSKDHANG